MAYLTRSELEAMGFASLGQNVLLSDKASFYNTSSISLGDHVRIDDFCVLSAGDEGIDIGSHIHVAVYCSLIGRGNIRLGDYANLSSRVSIYSSNDDYSGASMTNPMVPACYTNVTHAPVDIGRHVIIGSGSVVLPGTVLGEGAAVGALSLVSGEYDPFWIYAGQPAKPLKERSRDLLDMEAKMKRESR